MKLFALQGSIPFGEKVAESCGVSLSEIEDVRFEDGEHKIRSLESINGEDVYVIHSLYGEPDNSVNDKLNKLLFFIASLKQSCAVRVTAVVPYLAYSRKDRKTRQNDPVITRYVSQLFEAVGTDRLLTIDVHNIQAFQNSFRGVAENLEAAEIFSRRIASDHADENLLIISPDIGGMKRAERYFHYLKDTVKITPELSFIQKYRRGNEIRGDESLTVNAKNKIVIIPDDMISTGKTIARAAEAVKKEGAAKVIACVTHGLFTENPDRYLNTEALDEIMITNTVSSINLKNSNTEKKIKVVDVSSLFATVIDAMAQGKDLSKIIYPS